MIGCMEEARAVVKIPDQERWHQHPPMGEGWEFVGSGSNRCVYRAPSGVVYKRDIERSRSRSYGNFAEAENWQILAKVCPKAVPEHHLWAMTVAGVRHHVMAVEYVPHCSDRRVPPNDEYFNIYEFSEELFQLGITVSDLSYVNVRLRDDASPVLIDAGHPVAHVRLVGV